MRSLHVIQPTLDEQYGLIQRRQLLAAGFTDRNLRSLVGSGWLVREHHGIYRAAGVESSYEQRLYSACLVNGRGSFVTHRASCRLLEVDLGLPPVLELSVARSSSARTPDVVVHRPWRIADHHLTEIGVFAVTTPARTLVDLGAVVPLTVVTNAMEQILRRRLTSAARLRQLCDDLDHPRRIGPRVLQQALAGRLVGETPSDSDLELAMARLCHDMDLPMPQFQLPFEIDGDAKRIDFAYPQLTIAIEVDGWESHLDPTVFSTDRVRRNELEVRGWLVLNFTWHQIMHRPQYVARTIERALAARQLALGA